MLLLTLCWSFTLKFLIFIHSSLKCYKAFQTLILMNLATSDDIFYRSFVFCSVRFLKVLLVHIDLTFAFSLTLALHGHGRAFQNAFMCSSFPCLDQIFSLCLLWFCLAERSNLYFRNFVHFSANRQISKDCKVIKQSSCLMRCSDILFELNWSLVQKCILSFLSSHFSFWSLWALLRNTHEAMNLIF